MHTVRALGLQATLPHTVLLAVLAAGTLACALAFSTLQEKLFRMEGFEFGGFLTLTTYCVYVALAAAERRVSGDLQRRGRLGAYAWVSVLATAGYYLTNASLSFINYPTSRNNSLRLLQILPVMAIGAAVNKRQYGAAEYGSAAALVVGVVLFTVADAEGSPRFHPAGVALITTALVADAVVFYMSCFAAIYTTLVLLVTGELLPAAAYVRAHRSVAGMLAGSAAAAYLSVSCMLLLIKHFDATHAEMVKAARRVMQVLLSYLLFPKSAGWKTVAGGLLAFGALTSFHVQQRRRRRWAQHLVVPAGVDGHPETATSERADLRLAENGGSMAGKLLRRVCQTKDAPPEQVNAAIAKVEAVQRAALQQGGLVQGFPEALNGSWQLVFSSPMTIPAWQYIPMMEYVEVDVGAGKLDLVTIMEGFLDSRFIGKCSVEHDPAAGRFDLRFSYKASEMTWFKRWTMRGELSSKEKVYSYFLLADDLAIVNSSSGAKTLMRRIPPNK
eukprot:scaffold23.g4173.t1